jgi:hypothetical protein
VSEVITKRVFIAAANQVLQIVQGHWTDEPPAWADASRVPVPYMAGSEDRDYTRAVQTAEAYIILFRAFNSRFDEKRFLIACGLADAPAKPKRARTKHTCSKCDAIISATQAKLSALRADGALPTCADCVSAELATNDYE